MSKHAIPELSPVKSAHIAALGQSDGALYIKFKDGATYRYSDAAHLHEKLVGADSVGKAFREHVRGKMAGVKV